MKTLLLALLLALASLCAGAQYVVDPRAPRFEVSGIKYALTYQEEFGEVLVLEWDGNRWIGWGGPPEKSAIIASVNDAEILKPRVIEGVERPGSLHTFVEWVTREAKRRAALRANLPPPDPSDRIARFRHALLQLIPDGTLTVPPAPLP